MSGAAAWGPSEASSWLTRPLGHWEQQLMVAWPPGVPGPSRCTINNVTLLADLTTDIDPAKWEAAVRNVVFREPNLRTDVDLAADPVSWRPATDFSRVVRVVDTRARGCRGLEDPYVWSLVEEEANTPWQYGSGQPLYRHTLVLLVGGAVVMNCYHHAAGDGTSGMLATAAILDNYRRLVAGGQLDTEPLPPLPSIEQLTSKVRSPEVAAELVAAKVSRARSYKPSTPFSVAEMEANSKQQLPANLTMFREGSEDSFLAIRARCRQEKVTVNSLALAASYLAMAATCCSQEAGGENWAGLRDQLIDVPVNMRHRLDPAMANRHAAFLITEITTKCDVTLDTRLWELARTIAQQTKSMIDRQEHFIFSEAKLQFETGAETRGVAEGVALEDVGDVLVSNMMTFPGPLELGWARVASVHCVGSFWAPGFANYLLLFQATKHFNYDVCYCAGEKNKAVAEQLLSYFARIMETSHQQGSSYGLRDIMAGK